MKAVLEKQLALHSEGTAHVVVTMTSCRGETPCNPGSKAVITSEGIIAGTVGGGKIEARAISHAQALLREGELAPQTMTWNLQRDIGMSCGGEGTYVFEIFRPQSWHIAVFGAGHVAQALVRVLLTLDCRITCIDSRQEWLAKLPISDRLSPRLADKPESVVGELKTNFFIVMTQGHATDVPILRQIYTLPATPRYVGAIGSRVKADKLKRELRELGVEETKLEKLRCPIGLLLGDNSPAEIAISIAAEVLRARDDL